MEEINDSLEDVTLSNYTGIFEGKEYDSLEHLLAMGPSDLLELKRLTKLKDGHFARFQTTIKVWRAPATASTASAPATPTSVGTVEMGPFKMGQSKWTQSKWTQRKWEQPQWEQPQWEQPIVNHPDVGLKTAFSLKASLRKAYTTWKQARLVSLKYSIQS